MFNDKQLVKRAQQGDKQALAALYDEYQPRIYRYVFYRVGDVALAEDLTAEVFVSMVKSIRTYQEQGRPFLAWLYTIAGNTVRMYHRRPQTEWLPLPETLTDDAADPVAMLQTRLTHAQLMAAMPHLTEAQQQVILLKFVEGFSNAEVSVYCGLSEGAVKSLQVRALAALKRVLVKEMHYEPSS
jgi:RNA polymerase sigma-70 factor (ECF subfamily)